MRKWLLTICCLSLITCQAVFAAMGGAGAAAGSGNYGDWVKYISLVTGTTYSAWTNRGDVAAFAQMTPVGDGTYYKKYNLYPGTPYNFIFFATYNGTAPNGLTSQTTYYDAMPNSGNDAAFFVATDSNNPTATRVPGAAYFGSANGDGRRFVVPPYDTGYSAGSSSGVWVYCNWASSPTVSVDATPQSDTSVNIKLGAYGSWGTGAEEYKAIDVYGGGKWFLYRSTHVTANYSLIASSTSANLGANMTFLDTGLAAGGTYYYIAVASDAYKGAMNVIGAGVNAADSCLVRQLADGTVTATGKTQSVVGYDESVRPSNPIPVYFKVEAPDWNYIASHGNVVYLTPVGADGRVWPYKMPGKICRVYLPKV